MKQHKTDVEHSGFTIIENVLSASTCDTIIAAINQANMSKNTFRKSADLFAIRQFLKELPEIQPLMVTEMLRSMLCSIFGPGYFITKSIYFDKPASSNWFVSWHQDLTISVDKKMELPGFSPWTIKQGQYAVQPPLALLERNFTIRLHLDDTDEHNGALKVIPGSHRKGIYRTGSIDWSVETEQICRVPKGGMMIMHPLLMHASGRSTGSRQRRVVHIEWSDQSLPGGLQWSELLLPGS